MFKVKEGIKLFDNQTTVRYPTGNYGSFEIDGGSKTNYEGYSIGGRAVFMHNNNTTMGLFNEVNNQWAVLSYFNGDTKLYHAGNEKLSTKSDGVRIEGALEIGNSDTENYISFRGTTGDAPGSFNHTYIGEHLYSGSERSELLLFKGNDITGASGSDRIRMLGNTICFDTYTTTISGTFSTVADSSSAIRRMTIDQSGNVDIASGSILLNGSSQHVIQKLAPTSNYGAVAMWYKGGVSNHTYDPQIGHHNTGDTNGSITILPYGTSTSPWGGTVGLFISDSNLKYKNQNIFHDGYHPNADKWTTARRHTVTLTGDVTGSAYQDVDGTGNKTWTISTTVANDSHTHDGRYVNVGGDTMTGDLYFSNSGTSKRGIQGLVGDNDYWFVGGGATSSNVGYMEIAVGDDGSSYNNFEQIYVRQYLGTPLTGTVQRTLTLLDNQGNTSIPNKLSVGGPVHITGNASYVGSYGYNTLVLEDQSNYPGINWSHSSGNIDWLQRMNGANSSMEWAYRDGGNHTLRAVLTTGGRLTLKGGTQQETLVVEGDYPQITIRKGSIGDASIHYDAGYAKKWNVGPGAGHAEEDEFGFAIYSAPRGTHYGTPLRINAETGYVQIGDRDHPEAPLDVLGDAYLRSNLQVGGRFFKDLGGTSDYHMYVIPLIKLTNLSSASSESTFIGKLIAWRGNALYNPLEIDIQCQRVYNSSNYRLTYKKTGDTAFTPVTFTFGGTKYLGVKFYPSAAQAFGGVRVDGYHQGEKLPLQKIPYYRHNSGGVVINSEINNSLVEVSGNGNHVLGGNSSFENNVTVEGKLYFNKDGQTGYQSVIEIDHVENSLWPFVFQSSSVGNNNESGFWIGSNGYPDMRLRRDDGTVRAMISSWAESFVSNGFNVSSGDLKIGSTTVIDSNCNLTNINDITMNSSSSKITMLYNDHGSGAGWDTRIHIGKSNDLPNGTGFPTSTASGGYGIQFQANSDGAFFGIEQYSTGNYRPIINWGDDTSDSPFRIAVNNATKFQFDTSGNFTANGNVTAYSDITLKDNITEIDNALEKVNAIRGVTYDRIDQDNARHAGVIAQEVEEVLPEVVHTDDNGIKSVAYGNMVGLLIEAIKELKAEIEELKNVNNN